MNSESSNPRVGVPFTINKELHNLIRGTFGVNFENCTTSFVAHQPTPGDTKEYACIGNFWTFVPRGDGGENGHSSGISGPIASRDDGAIFLTAAKTNKGSVRPGFLLGTQDMILFQHRVRRDGQTVRVCAVFASLIPIRRATHTIRPPRHGHTRTDARRRPPPFYVGILERLSFLSYSNFETFETFKNKGTTKKHKS